jgi:hypothetical protein
MNLYICVENSEVINVSSVKNCKNEIMIKVKTIEDFYVKMKEFKPLSNEMEEKAKELFEEQQENSSESSLESFNIKHWVSNRSFGELIDMYITGEIIKPDMQRNFVWDSIKCSRLIESIILGLPIPPLFLLEVESNKYEIIDGYQRLTTVVNYVTGKPWNFSKDDDKNRKIVPSKLSGVVSKEIANKPYNSLHPEHQRILKRSTIPLIEFRQLSPTNFESKYLIFERINTGSEKLNPMQIRKSLAYGNLMNEIYQKSEINQKFTDLFTVNARKKDVHVEAYLRIYAMTKIHLDEFRPTKSGIKNLLNEFCETQKESGIPDQFTNLFNEAFNMLYKIFGSKENLFKRIEKDLQGNLVFAGNINVSIMESFVGSLITCLKNNTPLNSEETILNNYKSIMHRVGDEAIHGIDNPFTTSTGTTKAIKKRFTISHSIMERK